MSFVAPKEIRPVSTEPDVNDGGASVKSDDFWPEITLSSLRLAMRINGLVTTDRLMHATSEAVLNVNGQLAQWMADRQAEGAAELADVAAGKINSESAHEFRYRRAVYCATKALLTEGYRDVDTTGQGEKHAAALTEQIDTLWRDSVWAVRAIIGAGRGLAELV